VMGAGPGAERRPGNGRTSAAMFNADYGEETLPGHRGRAYGTGINPRSSLAQTVVNLMQVKAEFLARHRSFGG
jgi:hypothetical protein